MWKIAIVTGLIIASVIALRKKKYVRVTAPNTDGPVESQINSNGEEDEQEVS